jgi:hypothetical protein
VLFLEKARQQHLKLQEARMNSAMHLRHLEMIYTFQRVSSPSWSDMFAVFMDRKMTKISIMPVTGCLNLGSAQRTRCLLIMIVYINTF